MKNLSGLFLFCSVFFLIQPAHAGRAILPHEPSLSVGYASSTYDEKDIQREREKADAKRAAVAAQNKAAKEKSMQKSQEPEAPTVIKARKKPENKEGPSYKETSMTFSPPQKAGPCAGNMFGLCDR